MTMPNRFLTALLLLCSTQTFAQPGKYIALLIPDSLQKNADVVVREEAISFKVKDVNNAMYQVHRVATILNSDGKDELEFAQTSDKFDYLEDAEMIVYDAAGQKLNSYTKKEMNISGYGEGLVEDGKTTWFRVTAASYPITVETNFSIRFKGILGYPAYDIQRAYQSVQQSSYRVEVPASLGLHYRCMNAAPAPQASQQGEVTSYAWNAANLTACKMEKHCGSFRNYLPYVQLAPNRFQMDNYEGDMTSWKEFGKWRAMLVSGIDGLSAERQTFFKNLVKDATTDRQKAEIIYHYLQQNMRYVSIQLGIGGWKPFPASFVDEKKYGDCKALSNYMRAALTAVGVKSYSTAIHWDQGLSERMKEPLSEDFPVNRFNHVLLCIPQASDSIWLECTSTTNQFGELSYGTQNRKALMMTDDGGALVTMPASRPQQNRQGCHTDIQLADDGSGKVTAAMEATGDYRQLQLHYLVQGSTDEKKRFLTEGMDWKHPDDLKMSTGDKTAPVFITSAIMQFEKIPMFITGSKMFLPVRLYPLMEEDIPDNARRTQDYFFSFPYQNTDTTVYHLPAGFEIDYKPADKAINYPFGTYHSQWLWDAAGQTLTVIARLEVSQSMVKATDYQQLNAFNKAVSADTNEKIVIKKP